MNPPHQAIPSGDLLSRLNRDQREAVTHTDGPLLVLAGAGSGKTRVITHRIAHMILELGVHPSRIVAVTFTNKASSEMRERVEALVGSRLVGAWIGTFHALCVRILRRDGTAIGLEPGFNIYDTDDQKALIKRIVKSEAGDEGGPAPRAILSRISRAKNSLIGPEEMAARAFTAERQLTARVFALYQHALRQSNAVDFDDLLLRTIELFRDHPTIGAEYAERCQQLLVDEYQDTNRPQYLLVRALSAQHRNVCVVGDEDQSIYRFRGAELRNILEFENDHDGTRVIRLEQNYRSTGTILKAAGAVVEHNLRRKGKTLWTENPDGERLELFRAPDDRTEAAWIAERIGRLSLTLGHDQMAILYRTNAQSRLFEEILRRERIPFQIVGSVQFYARKEVKDVLAYLRLAANPVDDVAFRRVINTPTRGIGATTLAAIERLATTEGRSMLDAARHGLDHGLLATRSTKKLEQFLELIDSLCSAATEEPPASLLERVVDATDYPAYLERAFPGLGAERMENVQSLISAAVEFAEESDDPTLVEFLDRSALVADADDVGREPGVTLMTIHCAKGLEFPAVFLAGLEENVFPHAMSLATGQDEDVEEERRLCYVAMTRAREFLCLSLARFRRVQGVMLPNPPSRFVAEIPAQLIDEQAAPAGSDGLHEQRGWGADGWGGGERSSAAMAARHRTNATPRPVAGPPAPPAADGLNVGVWVRHPRFGGGRILQREGDGKHLKLTIQFSSYGPKKILASYTTLEIKND